MTTNYHTPASDGGSNSVSVLNNPLGQLDSALTTQAARISALGGAGGVVTLANGLAEAGQKVVPLLSTSGFVAGASVVYLVDGTTLEVNTIASVGFYNEVTLTNIIGGSTGILDESEFAQRTLEGAAIATAIKTDKILTADLVVGYTGRNVYYSTAYTGGIHGALAAANTAGGGLVIVAEGEYAISTGLKIGNNTEMVGNGVVVLKPQTVGMTLITQVAGATDNIAIRNIRVDGSDVAADQTAGQAIYLSGVSNAQITNCNFSSIPVNCVALISCTDSLISENVFDNIGTAGKVTALVNIGTAILAYSCIRLRITDNTINNTWQMAIFINTNSETDDGTTKDVVISGNTVNDCADNGIRLNYGINCSIIGNTIRDAAIDCIRANGSKSVVMGNVCTGDTIIPQAGIKSDRGSDYVVSDNVVTGTLVGIYWRCLVDVDNVKIADNSVVGCDTNIYVTRIAGTEVLTNFTIIDNVAKESTGLASSQRHGIAMTSVVGATISGNMCAGNAKSGISISNSSKVSIVANTCNGNAEHGIIVDRPSNCLINANICTGNSLAGITSTNTVIGTHDGAANAAVLTDSGEAYTINKYAGNEVYNLTDLSHGLVLSNTATTVTATLAGGAENDWDIGDTFGILSRGLTVSNNQCAYNTTFGIYLNLVCDALVNGNICQDNGNPAGTAGRGIFVLQSVNVVISANRCTQTGTTGVETQGWGLYVTKVHTAKVFGNILTGNETDAIVNGGNNTAVSFFDASYSITNVSTDRSYNADTVAVAELADIVGTLIADLRSLGIVK